MSRPRAIQYTVVTSDDFGKFEDRVNDLLGEGWQIQGGVSTAILPNSADRLQHIQWSQALTLSTVGEPTGPALALEEPLAEGKGRLDIGN